MRYYSPELYSWVLSDIIKNIFTVILHQFHTAGGLLRNSKSVKLLIARHFSNYQYKMCQLENRDSKHFISMFQFFHKKANIGKKYRNVGHFFTMNKADQISQDCQNFAICDRRSGHFLFSDRRYFQWQRGKKRVKIPRSLRAIYDIQDYTKNMNG